MTTIIKKIDRQSLILICLVCFFVGTICYIDMAKLIYIMDSDIVAEMNYMQRVWQTKSFLPEGWFHSQELLFSRLVFILPVLYGITNNFLLSHKISLILCCIVCIYMFYIYCKSIGFSFQTRLISILLFFSLYPGRVEPQEPSCLGMLFIGNCGYIVFLTIIFGTLTIRNSLRENNKRCENFKFKEILSFACACYIGMSGMKELAFFYLPWVLMELISCINFDKAKLECTKMLRFSMYNLISNLFGVVIMTVVIVPRIGFVDRNNYSIITSANLFDSFIKQVAWLLKVNGLDGGYSLKTIDGLTYLIYFVILIGIIWYFINVVLLNKDRARNSDIKLFNLRYWGLSTFVVFFYSTITGGYSACRYYMPYFVLCILVTTLLYEYILNKRYLSSKTLFACLCVFCVIQWTAFYMPWIFNAKYDPLHNSNKITLANTLVNDGYKMVYASYWNANILKGVSNGKLETAHFIGKNNLQPFEWLIDGNVFSRLNKAVLVLDSKENEAFQKNELMKHVVSPSRFIKKVDEFYIYKFFEGDLGITLSSLPQKPNQVREIALPNASMSAIKETAIKENGIETKGLKADRYVLFGPYVDIPSGTYNISFYYDANGEKANLGYFDVAASDGTKLLQHKSMEVGSDRKTTLDNVSFNKDKRVEFRAFQHKDTDLLLKKIEIQKIQ